MGNISSTAALENMIFNLQQFEFVPGAEEELVKSCLLSYGL